MEKKNRSPTMHSNGPMLCKLCSVPNIAVMLDPPQVCQGCWKLPDRLHWSPHVCDVRVTVAQQIRQICIVMGVKFREDVPRGSMVKLWPTEFRCALFWTMLSNFA